MGYHGGGSTTTTLIEYFTSESYRRTISDSTTLDTVWDESARVTLGDGGDLQVKQVIWLIQNLQMDIGIQRVDITQHITNGI